MEPLLVLAAIGVFLWWVLTPWLAMSRSQEAAQAAAEARSALDRSEQRLARAESELAEAKKLLAELKESQDLLSRVAHTPLGTQEAPRRAEHRRPGSERRRAPAPCDPAPAYSRHR